MADLIVIDNMHRALNVGDAVLVNSRRMPVHRIMAIDPVLDPSQPAGLVTVHLMAVQSFTVKSGTMVDLLRVAPAEEAGPMPVQFVGAADAQNNGRGN